MSQPLPAPSETALQVRDEVESFFDKRILPNHHTWLTEASEHEQPPVEIELRKEAKALGLWNLGLPRLTEDEPGTRLSNGTTDALVRTHVSVPPHGSTSACASRSPWRTRRRSRALGSRSAH